MTACGPMICDYPAADQFGRWSRWRCPRCGHRYYLTMGRYWFLTFPSWLRWKRAQ